MTGLYYFLFFDNLIKPRVREDRYGFRLWIREDGYTSLEKIGTEGVREDRYTITYSKKNYLLVL